MKKQVIVAICNMGKPKEKTVYGVTDETLKVSENPYRYPLNAYLEKNLSQGDDIKVILVAKKDPFNQYEQNIVDFEEELGEVNRTIGAKIQVKTIVTEFSGDTKVHHDLLDAIVDEIEENTRITVDMTFGPKDVPFVAFAALNFAERYLKCEINRILYGKADFDEQGKPVNTMIWDLGSIYTINSISNKIINCEDQQRARAVLKKLLTI
ncbi:MAG: hypothetical protein IJX02_05810 [Clostridia bacterium]|nr:hypothetical protein [Clostridia bacterium]